MSKIKITLAIAASYFIFAILLNSVGTVILQAINTLGVGKTEGWRGIIHKAKLPVGIRLCDDRVDASFQKRFIGIVNRHQHRN